MSYLLGQLVYTSFLRVGFRSISSPQVPQEIQQAFVQRIVHQYWDAYNPLESGHRAVYIHQVTSTDILFGWLYSHTSDEWGRCGVPYFISYYLARSLRTVLLSNMFTWLQTGPVQLIAPQCSSSLEAIALSLSYQPAAAGVWVPRDVQQRCRLALKQRQLINLFVPTDGSATLKERPLTATATSNPVSRLQAALRYLSPRRL